MYVTRTLLALFFTTNIVGCNTYSLPSNYKPGQISPVNTYSRDTQSVLTQANQYINQGHPYKASRILEQAIQTQPNQLDLRFKLLEAYAEMRDYRRFTLEEMQLRQMGRHRHIASIKHRYPSLPSNNYLLRKADDYIAQKNFNQAIELLQRACINEPRRTDLRLKLMETYANLGDRNGFNLQKNILREIGGTEDQVRQLENLYPNMLAGTNPPQVEQPQTQPGSTGQPGALAEQGKPLEPQPEVSQPEQLAESQPGKPEPLTESQPGISQPEQLAESQPGISQPEPLTESQPEISQPEPLTESQPGISQPEQLAESQPGKPEPLTESQPEISQPEPLAESQPGISQPEPLTESQPGISQPEQLAESQPGISQPEPLAESQPEISQPEPLAESQPEISQPEQLAESQPGKPEPLTESQPEPYQPEPVVESQPEPYQPAPEPQPQAYQPEPVVESQPEPYQPAPEPQPQAYQPEPVIEQPAEPAIETAPE